MFDLLIFGLITIPLANSRGSDSSTFLVTEPRALASGIVIKPKINKSNMLTERTRKLTARPTVNSVESVKNQNFQTEAFRVHSQKVGHL